MMEKMRSFTLADLRPNFVSDMVQAFAFQGTEEERQEELMAGYADYYDDMYY